jgi:diguanylate cyclase (GGDEF)-like protein
MVNKLPKLSAAADPVSIEAEVLEILDRHRSEAKLLKAITGMQKRHGDAVYPPLLYAFSHLRFSKVEATKHFGKIVAHKAKMGKKLGRTVDVRVALLDYFLSQHKRIEQPKIIELWAFQRTLQSAVTDELTGLYNYRFGREALTREIKRAERHREMVSVFLFDLDNFKRVNDVHGHLFGNEVLVEVAGMIRRALRDTDLAVRFGGEEFLIILPGTPKDGALNLAERLRQGLSRHEFHPAPKLKARVTLSGGIATFPNDGADASQLIKRADQALYTIKAGDKNGVALFSREQRTFTRVEAAVLGYFRLVGEDSAPLETVNLSMSGLLFTSDSRLPAGATLEIGLNLPGSNPPVPIKARVVRCAERHGRFEVAATIQQVRHPWQKKLTEFLEKKSG